MIEIDYYPGLHGFFLCYVINALGNDAIKQVNPFTELGTSHLPFEKSLAVAHHYSNIGKSFEGKNIISITANDEDCLLVDLLCYTRAGPNRLDINDLNINFYDKIKNTPYAGAIANINKNYNTDIEKTNSVDKGILREFFKYRFKNYSTNSSIVNIRKQKYNFDVLEFNFKQLYNFTSFILTIEQIIAYFGLAYTVDVEFYRVRWTEFMSKIQPIMQNQTAIDTLAAIGNKENIEIDFNLIQESWLNARLEIMYNKEMPFDQEVYFKNTAEILDFLNEI